MKLYDVIIVGSGPSGIFAALELIKNRQDIKILIIEKGKDIDKRKCPMKTREISCAACPECALLSGWGGAGAYSDGKLNLSPHIGGSLVKYVGSDSLESMITDTDMTYMKYGAPDELYGANESEIATISKLAAEHDLIFIPSRTRHIGTDRCITVLRKIKKSLNGILDILFNAEAERVLTSKKKVNGIRLKHGEKFSANYVILAPGREGSRWLERGARGLHLTLLKNPVDIGVRVEIPASVFEPLTKITYEPKLVFHSRTFNDRVRTFCVNPYGEVVNSCRPIGTRPTTGRMARSMRG